MASHDQEQTQRPADHVLTIIEHKMGLHGSATCGLSFWENGRCRGILCFFPAYLLPAGGYLGSGYSGRGFLRKDRSVVSFLTRVIIEKRLRGDLFASTAEVGIKVKKTKSSLPFLAVRTEKATGRR
jgi:hypothetical protein